MTDTEGYEAMVRACITAHEAVLQHGTSEMQLAARILLRLVGEQIAQQSKVPAREADNENVG